MEYHKDNLLYLYILQHYIKAYNYLDICFIGLNIVTIQQATKITIDFFYTNPATLIMNQSKTANASSIFS